MRNSSEAARAKPGMTRHVLHVVNTALIIYFWQMQNAGTGEWEG